jgi:hypothetical protein
MTMADGRPDPTPRIRRDFGDLRGEPLFARLLEDGNTTALELLWRANDPTVATKVASYLASANEPRLADLLLAELLTPTMGDVQATIFEAITDRNPKLSGKGVGDLNAALRDQSNGIPAVAARPDLLELWLFAQPGQIPDDYALRIIKGGLPRVPHGSTLAAAIARCKDNPGLRAQAATEYQGQLAATPDANSWNRAADFIEQACAAREKQPEVLALVADMVGAAPAVVVVGPVRPALTTLIHERGAAALRTLLTTPGQPRTPGLEALLAVIETLPDSAERLGLFLLAMRGHPQLWPALDPIVRTWDQGRWSELLDALSATPDDQLPDALSDLFALAAKEESAVLMRIAARRPDDLPLLEVARAKALEQFRWIDTGELLGISGATTEGTQDLCPVDAFWWPETGNEAGFKYLHEILASAPAVELGQILQQAYDLGRASAAEVAATLPDSLVAPFVTELRRLASTAAKPSRPMMLALHESHPEPFRQEAQAVQAQSFDLDIAAVVAATDPQVAFTNSEAAFDALSEERQDELLDLVEKYGGAGQIEIVLRFASSTDKQDRPRRARAFALYAKLVPPGPVPQCVVDGLKVADSAVSEAAFAAVSALHPRDIDLLQSLRDMARTDGNVARLSAQALDTISAKYVSELSNGVSEGDRVVILTLLGAAARSTAIDPLLGHLGDADSDAPLVHLAASAAVLEATPFVDWSSAQLKRLSDLLDGPAQENDPAVRENLSQALHRASLGADEALDLLYGELAVYRPTALPEAMFGPERATLLRQLALFKGERDRGAVGWAIALTHLDNVAERIVRAAYLQYGGSEKIKARIQRSPRDPEYGGLLQACDGELTKAKAALTELHRIRGEETEVPHPGQPTTQQSWDQAIRLFQTGARICLALLDKANQQKA